jgi:4'-phosphopantetheinyl transferase
MENPPLLLRDLGLEPIEAVRADLRERGHAATIVSLAALPEWRAEPLAFETEEAARRHGGPSGVQARGYLARRAIVRALLARIADGSAADIRIERTPSGAAEVLMPGGEQYFVSFSARDDVGAVALARTPIGIDIEAPVATGAIPWRVLRPEEATELAALPEARAAGQFTGLWAVKEAVMKALGAGVALPPEAIGLPNAVDTLRLFPPHDQQFPAISGATLLTRNGVTVFKAGRWDRGVDGGGGLAVAVVILTSRKEPAIRVSG